MRLVDESDRKLLASIRKILSVGVLSYKLHIELLDNLEASTIEAHRRHDDAMRLQISRMGGERVYAEEGEIAGSKRDPNDW